MGVVLTSRVLGPYGPEPSVGSNGTLKGRLCPADSEGMQALRWVVAGLLMWGLFTGIAYVLVPVLTDGWGNDSTPLIGIALIAVCSVGLLKVDPRRG